MQLKTGMSLELNMNVIMKWMFNDVIGMDVENSN